MNELSEGNDECLETSGTVDGRHPKRQAGITGVRKLILNRAQSLGITLADLSRTLGRNNAYVHQYIYKGTPRFLDEITRYGLGTALRLDPETLRDGGQPHPGGILPADHRTSVPKWPTPRAITLVQETKALDTEVLTKSARSVVDDLGNATLAVWVEFPHGRLLPGDIALAAPDRPIRVLDQVIILAGGAVASIGEVQAISATTITVEHLSAPRAFAREDVQILKIIGVAYP